VRTYVLYSDEGLIAEYDAQGNELRSDGWPPDATWGTNPLWLKQDGHYYWYLNDHLGTPPQFVAQNGAARWRDRDMRLWGSVFTWQPVLPHLSSVFTWQPVLPHLTGGGTIVPQIA